MKAEGLAARKSNMNVSDPSVICFINNLTMFVLHSLCVGGDTNVATASLVKFLPASYFIPDCRCSACEAKLWSVASCLRARLFVLKMLITVATSLCRADPLRLVVALEASWFP